MGNKILIVDDEITICELLKLELELEGYECEIAASGAAALEVFDNFDPELVLLDLMMPEMDGYEVCSIIREKSNLPIIMLTAKAEMDDKIDGLEKGADDYITKPFDTRELLARIKALIRRVNNISVNSFNEYRNKDLKLIPASQSAFLCGNPLYLTVTEYDILLTLIKNTGKVFSRDELAGCVGLKNFQFDTRSLDMHIQRLRKKLAVLSNDKYIDTVFGIGYKMPLMEKTNEN